VAITIDYDFSDGADYTFDADLIEVAGGAVHLILSDLPNQIFNQDFTDGEEPDFTFDPALVEFTPAQCEQVDQTPADSIMAATYSTVANLSWRNDGGSLVGTLNGAPTIAGGQLVCTGAQGVSYARTSSPLETWRVKYTPNYTGDPPTNINLISSCGTTLDRCNLTHSPSGDTMRITLYDDAGVQIYLAVTIGPSGVGLVADTQYEIEVNIDSVGGTVRLFIDGVLYGTLSPGAWSRGGVSKSYYVGADAALYNQAQASFDDYIVFDAIQHTVSYAPGYTVPEYIYLESSVVLPMQIYGGLGDLQEFSAFATGLEIGAIRWVLSGMYWDGAAWVASDLSYAQANSSGTVDTNIGTLPATDNLTIIMIFPNANDVQGSIQNLQIEYIGQHYSTDNPTITVNSPFFADKIDDIIETVVKAGSDDVRYVVRVGTQWLYPVAGVPTATDGVTYAQSGSIAEWADVWDDWDPEGGVNITIRAFLHSATGFTTPELENLTVEFSARGVPADAIETVIIFGYQNDPEATPSLDAIYAELIPDAVQYKDNVAIIKKERIYATFDNTPDGFWHITLVETDNMTPGAKYQFNINGDLFIRQVPSASPQVNFWDLPA